jgi:translation elongation factor EF-1alpha
MSYCFENFDRTLSHDQVISARKGEFETGYERGGQTREHVQLAKTLGVSKLLVVVNKMDEPTVNWSKERCFSLFESVHV